MDVIVPFAAHDPKTRLSDVLEPGERRAFARVMLADVLESIAAAGGTPHVLATRPLESDLETSRRSDPDSDPSFGSNPAGSPDSGLDVIVDDRDLTTAVNAAVATAFEGTDAFEPPVAVVMADLPLATPASLRRLLEADGEVVLAPGRGGGTNAFVSRDPSFQVDYHGVSIRDHRRNARSIGATLAEVDSRRLASDVDDREDLLEVLVHGERRAHEWLLEAGFEVATDGGDTTVVRSE